MTGAGPPGRRRTAVVSGGGTGIGRACSAALAGVGFDVVLLGRRGDVLAATAEELTGRPDSGAVTAAQCDVSDPADVGAWVTSFRPSGGGGHGIGNNPGPPPRRTGVGAPVEGVAQAWL